MSRLEILDPELRRFLKLVDSAERRVRKLYDLPGASCALHFNLEDRFEISEDLKPVLERELKKRDVGTPDIHWYNGHAIYVIIRNPHG